MKRRAPEIAEEANPSPRACIFQTRRGPPLGQESSSPVSGEIPSRLGPRHCGQSAAEANAQIDKQRRRMERHPDMWDKVTAAAGAMASGGCGEDAKAK